MPATALLLVPCLALLPNEVRPGAVVNDLVQAGARRPVALTSFPLVVAELGAATAAVIATLFV